MKKSTKFLVGLGITAVAGAAIVAVVSDKVADTVKQVKNRRLVKQFVNENLRGNEKLLTVVDDLSADEIDSVAVILDKISAGKNKISVSGKTVREATDEAKKMLVNFIEQWT